MSSKNGENRLIFVHPDRIVFGLAGHDQSSVYVENQAHFMPLEGDFRRRPVFFQRCNFAHTARILYSASRCDAFLIQNWAVLPHSRLAAVTDYDQFAIVGRRSLAVFPDPSAPPAPRGDCFEPLDTHPSIVRPFVQSRFVLHEEKFSCILFVIPLLACANE